MTAMVGRAAELALVGRFLDGLAAEPGALLVEGEAGVGKTTVWVAAIGQAESRGIRVLQARAAETEVQLAYAALADLVGADFDAARRALPPIQQRALAAALLRAESDELSYSRARSRRRSWESSHRLPKRPWFSWRSTTCSGSTPRHPRRSRSRSGGYRTGSACSSPGAAIRLTHCRSASSGRCPRVGWSGWCRDRSPSAALHHLLDDRLGSAPSRPALARLAEASGGNPFLALEIARALGGDWSSLAGGGPLPVPRDLQAVASERVGKLSVRGREASLAAAALSRPTRRLDPAGRCCRGRLRGGTARRGGGRRADDGGRPRALHAPAARLGAIYGAASPERRRLLHARLSDGRRRPGGAGPAPRALDDRAGRCRRR